MCRYSLFLTVLPLAISCVPAPRPPDDFKATINPQLTPMQGTIPDVHGEPQPVAVSRDEQGTQTEFLEGVALLRPLDDADLQKFLSLFGGTVVNDNTIPEPPPELGITLTAEQRKPTVFVIRFDLGSVDLPNVSANAAAAGIVGTLEFSSEAGLQTFAGIMEARAAGFRARLDRISQAHQLPPAFPPGVFRTLFSTQERQTSGPGAAPITYKDAFTEPRFGSGANTSNSNVTLAWQFIAAHGYQRRVRVAIIDSGFWLDGAGRGQVDPAFGNDSDFAPPPGRPTQYDFSAERSVADGPSLMACLNNPCLWHGTGSAAVATGLLENGLGEAGSGGQVSDAILFKIGGPADQRDEAVRTAVAWGADVVSMSFGVDCDASCRADDRGEGSISEIIDNAGGTVFVASAGNGRGNPAAGYDVSNSPEFVHPCTLAHVICVGALNDPSTAPMAPAANTAQSYSNFGTRVTIFAPTNIPVMTQPAPNNPNSAGPAQLTNPPFGPPNPRVISFGGTSASAPFVAGVAAMMKALNPNLSGDEAARILVETAQPGGDMRVTRVIDAFAAVHRAAEGIDNLADRFEPNNGPGAATDLGPNGPYNAPNLSLNAQDQDWFRFRSPGASRMVINLLYPVGIGDISVISLQNLGESCGAPTLVSNGTNATGRTLIYDVPDGLMVLGLRASDVNAYNLSISFLAPVVAPDMYEVNNSVGAAKYIFSFTPGVTDRLAFDPSVTINATIHNDVLGDVDYYIVRGARLGSSQSAFLFGGPFVSVYANTAGIDMAVSRLNDDGTEGAPVLGVGGSSCAQGLSVRVEPDLYYLVRVTGGVGQYTLFNGALADPAHLPDILVGGFPSEIVKPGPVEIQRELRNPLWFLFVGDPAFGGVASINPGVHLSLYDLSGTLLTDGVQNGAGERISLLNIVGTQGYALLATPTILDAAAPLLRLAWEPTPTVRDSGNLVINSGAEIVVGPDPDQTIPYWNIVQSTPTTLAYEDRPGNPTLAGPGPVDRGARFFAGGTDTSASAIRQMIVIDPAWREAIDAGRVKFRCSAHLGGSLQQPDFASVRLVFRRAGDSVIDVVALPTITARERQDQTGLYPVELNNYLPADTAVIFVDIAFTGGEGNFNDGYADNIVLVLTEYPS